MNYDTPSQLLALVHSTYLFNPTFTQLQHIPCQPPPPLLDLQPHPLNQYLFLTDSCLVLRESLYDKLYKYCLGVVVDEGALGTDRDAAADLLLCMNGEHDRGYAWKKSRLREGALEIGRQLRLNAAVVMKFKKSSSCYEFRMKLMEALTQQHNPQARTIMHSEHSLLCRILSRFPRNYFCWMYRLRLFKLLASLTIETASFVTQQAERVWQFVETAVNDYSALSYCRFVIRYAREHGQGEEITEILRHKAGQLVIFCQLAYQDPNSYANLTNFNRQLLPPCTTAASQ